MSNNKDSKSSGTDSTKQSAKTQQRPSTTSVNITNQINQEKTGNGGNIFEIEAVTKTEKLFREKIGLTGVSYAPRIVKLRDISCTNNGIPTLSIYKINKKNQNVLVTKLKLQIVLIFQEAYQMIISILIGQV